MKTSDLFVKALENEGVKYIFGIPGEENLDFLDSLKGSSIQLILTRHEQAAGFMAATYGRLTGEPGVCLSTLGPGATNFVTAAAYAQLGGMPMIMLGGQKPIRKSKQGRFQIVDVVGHRRPDASEPSIDQAVSMIRDAKLPLLLIGAGANRKRTSESLKELIDKSGLYFFDTQMGKGVVDERHERYIGTAALSDNDYLHCAIERSDLIINVGHDVIEKPPFFMEKGGMQVIHVNFDAANVDDVYFPQLNVVGDISSSISSITEKLGELNQDFSFFQRVRDEVDSHVTKYFKDTRFPILPQALVSLLREHLDATDIVTLDNGVYKLWFARNYECYEPNTLLLDNALATMGAGLPSAMAAKQLHPDRKVVSVNGDGGFLMNSQELETAVRMGLDLVVIILNDSAYGMIKWKQEGVGFDNFGLDFKNPDFIQYAKSFGATGYRAESHEHFVEILETSLSKKGVHIIDLPVDYTLNHSILNVLLKESACIV